MSEYPDFALGSPVLNSKVISPAWYATASVVLAALGLSAIWAAVASLWGLWTSDPLKSIGMVVPVVSLVLILRVWRKLGWAADGTWWGLVPLLLAIAAEQIQERAVLILVVTPHWSTGLPPASLVLLMYGSGMVLLAGGTRLYRAALFPILLLLLANPVPHAFSLFVDLPLQYVSAHIARAFATGLGYPLTPDHLRLMFTPEFGMFIAPGCNGIRGSVTMGFIALIAGYIYRFRWYINALMVLGAILLGYVFNLLRLCLLVVYYGVALHFPSLQGKAENADYLIGGTLFLVATLLLFAVIQKFAARDEPGEPAAIPEAGESSIHGGSLRYARLAVIAVTAILGWVGVAHAAASYRSASSIDAASYEYPKTLGSYTLTRAWNETQTGGQIVYNWAEYSAADGGAPIAIGVSPILGWHDALMCHTARGELPLWQGPLTVTTADGDSVSFSSAFYNDGVSQVFEASTQCNGGSCGETATERTHFGLIFTRLDPKYILTQNSQRPIPVLIVAETTDVLIPRDVARRQLMDRVHLFLESVRVGDLTRRYH